MATVTSKSHEETISIGRKLGAALPQGTTLVVAGPLGCGKTCLAKGVAVGHLLISEDEVTSPAFALVNEYVGSRTDTIMYHMDFYRLDSLEEHDREMFQEYIFNEGAITVAEWGDKFISALTDDYAQITISFGKLPDDRILKLTFHGTVPNATALLGAFQS